MKKLHILALAVTCLLLSACGGGPAENYSATGTWTGTTTNVNYNNTVTGLRFVMNDSNGILSGDVYVKSSTMTDFAKLTTLSGTRTNSSGIINFSFVDGTTNYVFVYSGTFNGNTFSGTYNANQGGAGPFTLTR